ncbi:tetratricopeptide repeat protein [Chitinispirillales bacterium ANBcel5]|uniref:tetratricopeptide repeat protein n=1 Tax=Cellulosispirillum alkaliphilum TaxID=3039283 RepID=UPI002A5233AD|nr:tetratricopeptide repeat protein [Chitinispirillales bacterium ANBcel5]
MKTKTLYILILIKVLFAFSTSECFSDAEELMDREKYSEAINVLQECEEGPEVSKLLGEAYFELFMVDQALGHLRKALEFDPSDKEIRIRYARVLAYNQEFRASIDEFTSLKEEYPQSREVLMGLAKSLGWDRKYRRATEIYESLLESDPDDYEVMLEIGILRGWERKYREAVAVFDKIIELPDAGDIKLLAKVNKAEVLGWQRRFDDAIEEYKKALSINPELIDAYLGLGTIYEWQGKYKEAIKKYEEALSVDPQNYEVKAKLEQLMWVR